MSYATLTKQTLEKTPPHDLEAERAILGAVLLDNSAIYTALSIMEPGEFYRPSHRHIFNAFKALDDTGEVIDLIAARDILEKDRVLDDVGGPAYLAALVDVVPTAANVSYHARMVHEKAMLRKLLNSSTELALRAYEDKEPSAELIRLAKENFENLWRLSFDPETVFWSQDNVGRAKAIDTERFLNFLEKQGFNMLEINETVLFIQNVSNILKETTWVKSINKSIKDMLRQWCATSARRDVWQILVDKGKLFSTQTLTGLDTLDGEFYKDDQEHCTLFFQNGAMEITASRVIWKPYSEVQGYIWEDQISEHEYTGRYNRELKRKIYDDMVKSMKARARDRVLILRRLRNRIQYFELQHGPASDDDIFTILHEMIDQASDVMTQVEATRPEYARRESKEIDILGLYFTLRDVEKSEYKRFLELVSSESVEEYTGKTLYVNNLHAFEYAIAYLVHGYNHKANMRAVVLADSNPSFLSNGRRGKGVILQALKHIKGGGIVIKEDGKAFSNGQFKFQLIRPNTRIVILDDVSQDFDFSWLYSAITDGLVVESKGFKRIAFPFEDSPRFCITTNHPCYDEGVSSSERAVLLPVADYFTTTGRTPFQEFGHMLFDDWDEAEWDRFFDYMVEIIQRYLQRSDPSVIPVVDLTIFNANKLLLKVPEQIVNYLDDTLEKEKYHEKDTVVADIAALGFTYKTSQAFMHMLHTYCRLRGYYLDKNTKDGRYMSNGRQYICLKPTTPDLYDTKYKRPKQ